MTMRGLQSFFDLHKGDVIVYIPIHGINYITYIMSDPYKSNTRGYVIDLKIMFPGRENSTTIMIEDEGTIENLYECNGERS